MLFSYTLFFYLLFNTSVIVVAAPTPTDISARGLDQPDVEMTGMNSESRQVSPDPDIQMPEAPPVQLHSEDIVMQDAPPVSSYYESKLLHTPHIGSQLPEKGQKEQATKEKATKVKATKVKAQKKRPETPDNKAPGEKTEPGTQGEKNPDKNAKEPGKGKGKKK